MSLKNFLLVRLLEKLGNVGGRTPIAIDKSVYEVRNDVVLCKTGKSFVSITKKKQIYVTRKEFGFLSLK